MTRVAPPRPPPPPPPNQLVDPDFQAVEGISRDTLVALLKRKDKEYTTLATKKEKLEERYVKVVRYNKILGEDRLSFIRFCNELLLPDVDTVFEEAAAQEIPVNIDTLLRSLSKWRMQLGSAREDRSTFQQFAQLVFPGDEVVTQLFECPEQNPAAFDVLQTRWVALEELYNQSIASVNSMAREQTMAKCHELELALAGRNDAERDLEEARQEIARLSRDKAHAMARKLASANSPVEVEEADVAEERLRSELEQAREVASDAVRALHEQTAELEKQRAECYQARCESDALREDAERHRTQLRQLVEQKNDVVRQLQQRATELEQELGSNSFIERFAEQQAGRDAQFRAQHKQLVQLSCTLAEIQKLLSMSYSQELVLKDRIRELEQSQGRTQVIGDYFKHVVLKYIEYTQRGDLKAQPLVPVLCTLLKLGPEERKSVDQAVLPQPFLVLNHAVGEAAAWVRGINTSSSGRTNNSRAPAEMVHPVLLDPVG